MRRALPVHMARAEHLVIASCDGSESTMHIEESKP